MEQELEEIQIKRLYFEYDKPFFDNRVKLLRRLLQLCYLIIAVGIILGFIIKYPKSIETDLVIQPINKDLVYKFESNIEIVEKYVANNSKIAKGQRLLKITSSEIKKTIYNLDLIKSKLELHSQNRTYVRPLENRLLNQDAYTNANRQNQYQAQLQQIRTSWNSRKGILESELILEQNKLERNRALYDSKSITLLELEKSEQAVYRLKNNLLTETLNVQNLIKAIELMLTETDGNIGRSHSQIGINDKKDSIMLLELNRELENLKNNLQLIYGDYVIEDNCIVLLSKKNGVINNLFPLDTEVPAREILIRISDYEHVQYVGIGKATPENISKIILNSQTTIKLDAYPPSEFGIITGKVKFLNLTPNMESKYYFETEIFSDFDKRIKLLNGMTGKVTILSESYSFWTHIFHNLTKRFN